MRFSFVLIVVALAPIILTNAKKHSTCRESPIFKDFDITRISGHWYAYSGHYHDFEAGCDCLTTEMVVTDSDALEALNCCQMTGVSNVTQKCDIGIKKAMLTNSSTKEALFKYTMAGSTIESNVWIVDTDYEHYLIGHGCDRVSNDEERELLWILSRNREITAAEVKKIDEVLKTNNFEKNKIIKHRHGVDVCKSKRPSKNHGSKGKM